MTGEALDRAPLVERVQTPAVVATWRVLDRLGQLHRWVERHPEWVALCVAAVAWLGLLAVSTSASPGGHTHIAAATTSTIDPLLAWTLMVLAMMLPSTVPHLRYIGFGVRRAVRQRAVLLFTLGYLMVWTLPGLLLPLLPRASPPALAALLLAAAAWELTRVKTRALRACCRTWPVRYRGPAADASAVEYGLRHGWVCLQACGPGMVTLMLAGHPWWATALLTLGMAAQKLLAEPQRWRAAIALGWLAAGLGVAGAGLLH